jgi:hypothetical protein
MKVSVKDLQVTMELKTKGMELDVYDNEGKHLGDLVVTKTKLIWCKGKTTPEKGISVTWTDFIQYMESRT